MHPAVDRFRCDDEDDPRLLDANCYFATCATAATSSITDMNFDVVILDAPATGHGLDMLRVPKTIIELSPPGMLRTV